MPRRYFFCVSHDFYFHDLNMPRSCSHDFIQQLDSELAQKPRNTQTPLVFFGLGIVGMVHFGVALDRIEAIALILSFGVADAKA